MAVQARWRDKSTLTQVDLPQVDDALLNVNSPVRLSISGLNGSYKAFLPSDYEVVYSVSRSRIIQYASFLFYIINVLEAITINPYPAKLKNINFHALKVVFRYRDPQHQMAENYWYLFNLPPNIFKYWCLNSFFPITLISYKRQKSAGKGLNTI